MWTIFMDIEFADYLPHANDETCVILQVESPDGVKNLESIAQVDGVDVVFAGPTDLAASLGYIGQSDHPVVKRFLEEFPRRVAVTGKPSGIAVDGAQEGKAAFDQGYRFINIGHILSQGTRGLISDLTELKEYSGTFVDAHRKS